MALTKVRGNMVNMADLDLSNVGAIQADSIAGDADTNTSITFSGSDVITIANAGTNQLTFNDGSIVPVTDNDIDLGTSVLEFKDAFFDGTVTSDAFAGPLTGNVTGNADTATALASGRTIAMTGDVVWTSPSFDGSGNVTAAATIQTDAVDIAMLSATGTASSSTFLRGDNSWTAVSTPITALNNATANELVTVGSTTTELDAEANLTFDGGTLKVVQGSDSQGIYLDMNGNERGIYVEYDGTTNDALQILGSTLTTGRLAYLYSNSSSTGTRNLVRIRNDNTLATGTTSLLVEQDSTGPAAVILGDVGIGTTSPATNLEVNSSASSCTIIRSTGTAADGYRHGFEASNTHTGGSIWSMSSTNNSDGYFGGGKFVIANETMGDVDANTAAKFVIDGTGNVGIGVTPEANWDSDNTVIQVGGLGAVWGKTSQAADQHTSLTNNVYDDATTGESFIVSDCASKITLVDDHMAFHVSASGTADNAVGWMEMARINNYSPAGGNMCVGTTASIGSSSGKFFVNNGGGGGIISNTTGGSPLYLWRRDSGAVTAQVYITFWTHQGNDGGNISTDASGALSVNQASDYRIKENVVSIGSATEKVKQLNPIKFNIIGFPDLPREGFLAHEVQEIVPQAVIGEKDAVDDDGEIINQVMDATKLIPIMVKTIQELEARIATLEAE